MGSGASTATQNGAPSVTVGGKGGKVSQAANELVDKPPPTPDSRLPFTAYRDLFTLKNFWKTVQRNKETSSKEMLFK